MCIRDSHYPVKAPDGRILGVLTRPALALAKKNELIHESIPRFISNSHGAVSALMPLRSVFSLMDQNNWYTASIYNTQLVEIGILDRTSLETYLKKAKA